MSKNIDKRIVEMSFENEKFERGIKNSKNSLREFTDALEKSDNNKPFSGLSRGLGDMTSGFSALEQIAIGALRRIGSEAVAAGARFVKSIAIEPITQGFQELELKMDSTKTIMASTGESLHVVNEYLDELNHYSDRTIYSFSDMTQNIGKFTNAGVKLELAVASIQGIANAAALAGANSNEASRAMYNFAQALSAGSVKLIDWKSIENANMATVEFKQQLIDSAVAAGTLKKTADGLYKVISTKAGSKGMADPISATRYFNESLQHQWMTTEVLTSTLSRYADETTEIGRRAIEAATAVNTFTKLMDTLQESVGSGWARTFELIFGDFEESKALWTGINDAMGEMIGAVSDARNALLEYGLSSGWKQFVSEGISNIEDFENTLAIVAGKASVSIDEIVLSAGSMEKAVKKNWLTGEILADTVSLMTDNIKDLSEEQLKNAGYTVKSRKRLLDLRDAFLSGALSAEEFATKMSMASGRENIIEGLKNSVIGLLTVLKPIAAAWDQIFPPMAGTRLYDLTEGFKNFTAELKISDSTADKIQRTFAGVFAVLDVMKQALTFVTKGVLALLNAFIPVGYTLLDVTARLGDFLVGVAEAIESNKIFAYALLAIKIAVLAVVGALVTVYNYIKRFVVGLLEATDPVDYLTKAISKFGEIAGTVFSNVLTWMGDKLSIATAKLEEFFNIFKPKNTDGVERLLDVIKSLISAVGVGLVTAFKKLKDILGSLSFDKVGKFVTGGILILLGAQLTRATKGFADLASTAEKFIKTLSKNILKSNPLKDLAVSIGLLAGSIWLLSTVPAEKVKQALLSLGVGITVLVGAYALLRTIDMIPGKGSKISINVLSLSTGLLALVGVLKILTWIDASLISKALPNLALLIGIVTAMQVLLGLAARLGGGHKLATSMLGVSAGLVGITAVVAILAFVPDAVIRKGFSTLAQLGAILVAIELFLGLAARIGGGKGLATSLSSTTFALAGMTGIIALLSTFTDEQFDKGLASLLKLMGLVTTMHLLSTLISKIGGGIGKEVVKSILQLIAIAGVVAILAGSLIAISKVEDSAALTAAADSLYKVIAAVGVLAAGMAILTAIGTGWLQSLIGLGIIIVALFAVVLSFVGLAYLMNNFDSEALTTGFDKLGQVATAMGNFIGNIVGGRFEGVLERLGIGLVAFFESISGIDKKSIELLPDISKALLALAVAGFLDSLSSAKPGWLGGSSSAKFIEELDGMIATLAGLETDNIADAAATLEAMDPMLENLEDFVILANKIPESGPSIASFAIGDNKIDDFAKQLYNLIKTLNKIKHPAEAVKAASVLMGMSGMLKPLEGFITLANLIPESGPSIASFAIGDNRIDDFAKQLLTLVELFKDDNGDAAKATATIEALGPLATALEDFVKINTDLDGIKGKGIAGLGTQISDFVKAMIEIKWEKAVEELENIKDLGQSLATIAEIEISTSKTNTIIISLTALLDSINAKMLSYAETFRTSGRIIFNNFKDSFTSKTAQNSLAEIGEWIPQSIANGILKNADVVTDAGVKIGEDLETAIRDTTGVYSESDDVYVPIGEWISKSIGNGLEALKGWLLEKGRSLGIDLGDVTTEGISDSLESGEGIISKGINALFDKLTGAMNTDELVGGVTKTLQDSMAESMAAFGGDEIAGLGGDIANNLTEAFQDSISNSITGLGGSETEERIKTELEKLQEYISEEQYYGRISLREELEEYKKLQATYEAGSEERMKIDKEVYRLEKTIYENQKKYIEDVTNAHKDAAAQRETLENDLQNNLSSIYKKHQEDYTNIVREAESQRQQIRESYAQERQNINDKLITDIQNLTQAYDDAVKSRTEAIAGAYGLFDEVTKSEEEISGQQLLDNLRGQVDAVKEWDKAIGSLAARGITGALLEELQKMGPSATEKLQSLLTLSDAQLDEYVALFDSKYSLARTNAETELIGLKNSTAFEIYDLRIKAEEELGELELAFLSSLNNIDAQMKIDLTDLNNDVQLQVDELKTAFDNSLTAINVTLAENLKTMKDAFGDAMDEIDDLSIEELEKLNVQFAEQIEAINQKIDADLETMVQMFAETGQEIKGQTDEDLTTLKDNYGTSGATAVANLASGILSELPTAESAAKTLVDGVLAQLRVLIDGFYAMGVASASAYTAGINMTENPSVDIIGQISGSRLVTNVGTLGSADIVKANTLSLNNLAISSPTPIQTSQNGSKITDITYTQNNYSPKALSRLEIYRDTKTQLATLKEAVSQI